MSISANSKLHYHTSSHSPDLRIFVKDTADTRNHKRPLTVRTWSTIKDVKDQLQRYLDVPPSRQRLFLGPLLTSGRELPNHRMLHDAGIFRSGETLLLEIRGDPHSSPSTGHIPSNDLRISSSLWGLTPRHLRHTIQRARRGLSLGFKPQPSLDGSGGTYFLCDARKAWVGVFKPGDEEAYAINNPRGYLPSSSDDTSCMRAGITPGEGCLREVAAYLLDHSFFSDVPPTTLVEVRHPGLHQEGHGSGSSVGHHVLDCPLDSNRLPPKKVGSFQAYVKCECTVDDMSPSLLSVDEVHKIAILDIRLLNADRNSANLLCRRNPELTSSADEWSLVPIDHGLCLRASGDVAWYDWCWLDWPQTKLPMSPKSREYVLNLDVESDVKMLRERLHLPQVARDYYRASCALLKAGVKSGMTLYDIAVLCCRNDDAGDISSRLEIIMSMASEMAQSAVHNGRWHHAAASRALAERLAERKKISKSLSTTDARAFQCTDSFVITESPPPTHMTPSSGSDSSSDVGDVVADKDECEEWAAAVLGRVELKRQSSMRAMRRPSRQRALSITSPESPSRSSPTMPPKSSPSLSCSPVGFWHVPPGHHKQDEDGKNPSWSLQGSIQIELAPTKIAMKRSQSYSAFSVSTLSSSSSFLDTIVAHSPWMEKEGEQFRLYFLKFIALLIKRETHSRNARLS